MRGFEVRKGSWLLALSALILVLGATPGLAHHKSGHEGGPKKDKSSSSGVTEDNDSNDGGTPNNVADDGDNEHPSGKDRSEEHGNSGNQGNSPSDPDGDSNGGPDKPGGSGGVDLADQDGNNGCGNDDDFEDDNNGNCGKKKEKDEESTPACSEDATMSEGAECEEDEVAGSTGNYSGPRNLDEVGHAAISAPVASAPDASVVHPVSGGLDATAEVLSDSIARTDVPSVGNDTAAAASVAAAGERPAMLAFTGADILTLLTLGLGLFVTGMFILRLRAN
jgi:hypothetical protein